LWHGDSVLRNDFPNPVRHCPCPPGKKSIFPAFILRSRRSIPLGSERDLTEQIRYECRTPDVSTAYGAKRRLSHRAWRWGSAQEIRLPLAVERRVAGKHAKPQAAQKGRVIPR